ncbi:hypothetical protein GCM10023195_71190 [Actinoallomurus liliacearum]|uniref:Uncharacterized protein n=1 Tax=Actinoallomurus liliacearum TaxID=1080073 RepID=A0ABP8TXL7_9ACTN
MMAIPPVMDLFGRTLLTTPELDSPPMARASALWTASETIADTCFVVLAVIGGLLLMSGNAVAPGTAAKDIVPRLLLAFSGGPTPPRQTHPVVFAAQHGSLITLVGATCVAQEALVSSGASDRGRLYRTAMRHPFQ